jgi:hypothetical protein
MGIKGEGVYHKIFSMDSGALKKESSMTISGVIK